MYNRLNAFYHIRCATQYRGKFDVLTYLTYICTNEDMYLFTINAFTTNGKNMFS